MESWREDAKKLTLAAGALLVRKDRWVHSVSFLVAAALHVPLLVLGGHQYLQAASHPEQSNQAVQRLQALTNDQGKPIRFIYVKDAVPSAQKPLDSTRLSDLDRRGASPDPRKGDSPDPTSLGGTALRQRGGPGNAPFSRPASQPSTASPEAVAPRTGQAGREFGRPNDQGSSAAARDVASAAREVQGDTNTGRLPGKPTPSDAREGLPVGGEREGGQRGAARPGASRPPVPPSSGRPGLGTQLQQMSAGALQGGFNNPNASRLNTGDLSFDTAGWDLGPYARRVQERVQGNWRTPEAQMILRQKGWVAIHFNIQKNGRITDLQVVRSSGIPSYDQSAQDALRASDPLPALPDEVTVPQLGALFRFFYNMSGEE